MTPTIRNLHDAYIHVVVRSFLKENNLPCTSLFGYVPFYVSIDSTFWIEISRTGSTKQDYRAIDAMFLHGRFRSKCNANASGCDQIVPTRVTDAGQSIHLGIYSQYSTSFAMNILGLPGCGESGVASRYLETL